MFPAHSMLPALSLIHILLSIYSSYGITFFLFRRIPLHPLINIFVIHVRKYFAFFKVGSFSYALRIVSCTASPQSESFLSLIHISHEFPGCSNTIHIISLVHGFLRKHRWYCLCISAASEKILRSDVDYFLLHQKNIVIIFYINNNCCFLHHNDHAKYIKAMVDSGFHTLALREVWTAKGVWDSRSLVVKIGRASCRERV